MNVSTSFWLAALVRLASFPEQNLNPVIETDLAGHVTYCNPAARERFADLSAMGHHHPILGGVKPIIIACQTGEQESVTREIPLGDAIYEQKIWALLSFERLPDRGAAATRAQGRHPHAGGAFHGNRVHPIEPSEGKADAKPDETLAAL
mgnify:CR=1 FL=1